MFSTPLPFPNALYDTLALIQLPTAVIEYWQIAALFLDSPVCPYVSLLLPKRKEVWKAEEANVQ